MDVVANSVEDQRVSFYHGATPSAHLMQLQIHDIQGRYSFIRSHVTNSFRNGAIESVTCQVMLMRWSPVASAHCHLHNSCDNCRLYFPSVKLHLSNGIVWLQYLKHQKREPRSGPQHKTPEGRSCCADGKPSCLASLAATDASQRMLPYGVFSTVTIVDQRFWVLVLLPTQDSQEQTLGVLLEQFRDQKSMGMGMFKRTFARTIPGNVRALHMKMWGFEAKRARKFTRNSPPNITMEFHYHAFCAPEQWPYHKDSAPDARFLELPMPFGIGLALKRLCGGSWSLGRYQIVKKLSASVEQRRTLKRSPRSCPQTTDENRNSSIQPELDSCLRSCSAKTIMNKPF